MKPRTAVLALGVALPTIALGAGWYLSTLREQEARRQLAEGRLEQAAEVVRSAALSSLEGLRAAEDAREFFLYNHLYSPPDVAAVTDPVAVSPLAAPPRDPRIIGYFQVMPDGTVVTPHAEAGKESDNALALRVKETVSGKPFEGLRAFASAGQQTALVVAQAPQDEAPEQERRRVRREPALSRQGPLTVTLNRYAVEQFRDIQAAQAGSISASERVQARGRQVLPTRRNAAVEAPERARSAMPLRPLTRPVVPSRPAYRRPRRSTAPPPVPKPTLANLREREEEVTYSAMAYRVVDDAHVALFRTVVHQDAAVVQGALLDRQYLRTAWLEDLAQQHSPLETAPMVVARGDASDCAAEASAPPIAGASGWCFPESALDSVDAEARRAVNLQGAVLLGLAAIVGLALFLVGRAARKEARLIKQKGDFISAVSHELRTPLTTLRLHAEMLQEGLVDEERRPRVFGELVRESVRLSGLVENVLELSRLDEGKRPLRRKQADLREHVRRTVEAQRPQLKRRGATVTGPQDGEAVPVSFDPQALDQILTNLLDNAAKYGGVDSPATIQVSVEADAKQALVSIKDNGPGVPATEQSKIFERFHRVERQDLAHVPGTGIGLSLVRDLAAAHGG